MKNIAIRGQSSGEYIVMVDGKFYCTCDNYREAKEEVEELESTLDEDVEITTKGAEV